VKVENGKVEVKATFAKPGTYTLRAFGHDTLLRAPADVTVNVDGPDDPTLTKLYDGIDVELVDGFRWSLQQPWVTHGLRELLEKGLVNLPR